MRTEQSIERICDSAVPEPFAKITGESEIFVTLLAAQESLF